MFGSFAKRIFLFLAVNLLVVLTISLLMRVLGVQPYITSRGLDLGSLAIFCLIWGFGGAFISLGLSRIIAKFAMGVQLINPERAEGSDRRLLEKVYKLARDAGLKTMPEVGIYDSPDLNAFATGPTKNRALVAVSSGLLERMTDDEVEGVLGHEITHISNGDMVTMTLLQGVVNAFVMFLSRVLAWVITSAARGDRDRDPSPLVYFVVQIGLEIILMVLGSILVAAFSRYREFRADAGGAHLAGKAKMIGALRALQRNFEIPPDTEASAIQTLQISGQGTGMLRFFASHPPLEERIRRLSDAA